MKNILFILLLAAFAISCKHEIHEPFGGTGNAPQPLKNAVVENLPGAAKISYTLPSDPDVLYIKASYIMQSGERREVKSSYYTNFVLAEGFADTLAHEITLSVITKSNKESEAIKVIANPLTAPVITAFRSLVISEELGGINVKFSNPTKSDIVIISCTTDTTGVFGPVNLDYTDLPLGLVKLRGYDTTARKFSFYVKDRWGNFSDTLTGNYKPLYAKLLDKKLFQQVLLPGDVEAASDWGDMSIYRMWDGSIGGWDMWHAKPGSSFPMSISFDMGVLTRVGLVNLWQRQDDDSYMYAQNNVKHLEIWGRADVPTNGDWDGWVKLADHTLKKPSGLPVGQVSQADKDAAIEGEEIPIDDNAPEVRYIRLKILEVWQPGANAANIAEMSFWKLQK